MNKSLINKLVVASFSVIAFSSPAMAEDEEARRAILELRAQIKHSDAMRNELSNQIVLLQEDIRKLRGQVEVLSNSIRKQNMTLKGTGDITAPTQVGDPTEQNAYDTALDLFRQGNYQASATALANFTSAYPTSVLVPSALFYEGGSRYAIKDFKGSISTLNRMVEQYPNDPQAGDALLVIAGNHYELNNINEYKSTLNRIIKQYPGTPAADTAKERLNMN
ncbi:tol-pal system protein YbgF [Taylorella equigenitalis]|uniref:Cell division coordinator CpoB n=3 Tax=Taylorella equigenitalis TaxID=29575 RepID=A0A654KHN4_TAYEM|nr:tol-pal system protein YbgF [Taylorella equigenitalis]ADU91909.1 TPR repeat containing exported protein [Taylorella equigenitalis MCE9]AFN35473.1 putative periplasmic protein [Taylorella equigenitalis ATCC 35865]ASY37433.1 tol-pal system protein YbgF [Taylorella equigenitalis]ASY38902.1 tol-pal system protein YbgF [Taylorella equigenitalis]ASY40422.1 tol-pal system protein YbgF [Taylorella equigenitalis]